MSSSQAQTIKSNQIFIIFQTCDRLDCECYLQPLSFDKQVDILSVTYNLVVKIVTSEPVLYN